MRAIVEASSVVRAPRRPEPLEPRLRLVPVRGYDKALARGRHALEQRVGLRPAARPLLDEAIIASGGTSGGVSSKVEIELTAQKTSRFGSLVCHVARPSCGRQWSSGKLGASLARAPRRSACSISPNHPGDLRPTRPISRPRCVMVGRMSPSCYRIVIEGELGPRYASAFDGMTLRAHDGETELIGPIIDPSHLQGLLERIAGLGLTLRSLNPLDTETAEADARPHPQPAGVTDEDPGTTFEGTVNCMTFLWILLAILYVACWIYFGLATFRKGHYWMFWIGFFLPFLWIIGALIAPTDNAIARASGAA